MTVLSTFHPIHWLWIKQIAIDLSGWPAAAINFKMQIANIVIFNFEGNFWNYSGLSVIIVRFNFQFDKMGVL